MKLPTRCNPCKQKRKVEIDDEWFLLCPKHYKILRNKVQGRIK